MRLLGLVTAGLPRPDPVLQVVPDATGRFGSYPGRRRTQPATFYPDRNHSDNDGWPAESVCGIPISAGG
jgi:hypothetical protein